MDIPTDLKNNLIADVENICEMDLPEETRISLERAFEITIGTYALTNATKTAKKLNKLIIGDISNTLDLHELDKRLSEVLDSETADSLISWLNMQRQ